MKKLHIHLYAKRTTTQSKDEEYKLKRRKLHNFSKQIKHQYQLAFLRFE